MGKDRKYKISDFYKIELIEEPLQSFVEKCIYSCSKNGEMRNFALSKTYYKVQIWKFTFNLFRRIKVRCTNCNKTSYLPYSLSRQVFKNGIKSGLLLKFSNDKVLSSWILNFLAKFWLLFGFAIVCLLIFVGIRFFAEPVQTSEPREVTFAELTGNTYLGDIVKVKGNVDYTLAFTKDEIVTDQRGNVSLSSREVYLPLFSNDDALEFLVIKGGRTDINNVSGRIGVTSNDILKNQQYEVIGRVEPIENLGNDQLRTLFTQNIPASGTYNQPKILINSADLITINDFINRYINIFVILLLLFITSIALQFYIDRRILEKQNTKLSS